MTILGDIYRSVVRGSPLSTEKGKVELVFYNLWLHVHPAKVRKEQLKFRHTFYLGFVSFFLLLILVATGVALMFHYHPYPERAYQDLKDLRYVVFLGSFVRNMHRWAAQAMVVAVVLHLCRVFYTASYKAPREFNWVVGVLMLLVTLSLSFTGYLLPWDQRAYWAIAVGSNIVAYTPVVGGGLKLLLLGGHSIGDQALLRFYVLHVAVLPGILVLLTMVHVWRIRKDGGLSRPLSADAGRTAPAADVLGPPGAEKTYGLMAIVDGTPVPEILTAEEADDLVPAYPYAFYREAAAFLLTSAAIMAAAIVFHSPLDARANPAQTPSPAKAPWYFTGIQELVSHSTFIGGVVTPALLVLALLALPYLDRSPHRTPRERRVAIALFFLVVLVNVALILLGTFFRGPGWSFVWPWAANAVSG